MASASSLNCSGDDSGDGRSDTEDVDVDEDDLLSCSSRHDLRDLLRHDLGQFQRQQQQQQQQQQQLDSSGGSQMLRNLMRNNYER